MGEEMKLVCEIKISGVDTLVALTTVTGLDIGAFAKVKPGVGKPFYVWPSIPHPNPTSCDFSLAPLVTSDTATNNAAIAAMQAAGSDPIDPADVLTWA
jgi:hypothetical protein